MREFCGLDSNMPSGKTHTRIDLFFLVFILGAAWYFWPSLVKCFGRDEMAEYGIVFVVTYLFGTFLLSPDMDLNTSDPLKIGVFCVCFGAPMPMYLNIGGFLICQSWAH